MPNASGCLLLYLVWDLNLLSGTLTLMCEKINLHCIFSRALTRRIVNDFKRAFKETYSVSQQNVGGILIGLFIIIIF